MKIKVLPRAECFAAAHGWESSTVLKILMFLL